MKRGEEKRREEKTKRRRRRRKKRRREVQEKQRYGTLYDIYICLDYVWIISKEKVYGMVWN